MNWVKLTRPDDEKKPVYVNLDLVVEIIRGNFWRTDYETTRLYTGHVAMAANAECSGREFYAIDVVEPPEEILVGFPYRNNQQVKP